MKSIMKEKRKVGITMAFFDDLGKKITQAGQSAVQKTKEVADIARLNSAIYDEEKRIDSNYLEIGKLYVAMRDAEQEADFDRLVAAIHESEGKIRDLKHQIKDIKGVGVCEKCGAEVPANAAFCSACGAPMPAEAPVTEAAEENGPEEVVEASAEESDPEEL